jgi:hypothetical protein
VARNDDADQPRKLQQAVKCWLQSGVLVKMKVLLLLLLAVALLAVATQAVILTPPYFNLAAERKSRSLNYIASWWELTRTEM